MKLHCDIIQDLIPSYVDGLCSETSKNCVEEHLQDCKSCRQFADLCKNNSLSGDTLEQKQLDAEKSKTTLEKAALVLLFVAAIYKLFRTLYLWVRCNIIPPCLLYTDRAMPLGHLSARHSRQATGETGQNRLCPGRNFPCMQCL